MALVEGTIAIILYIAVILIIFKLVRSIIKTVLLGLLLFSAIFAISGFLIISDFNDLRENFGNSSKIMYLTEGDNLLAGFAFKNLESENMTFIELEELENLESSYAKKDYKYLLKNNYKAFIFDIELFNETMNQGMDFEMDGSASFFMSAEKINESLYSDNPLEFLYELMFDSIIEEQIKAKAIPAELLENPEMKAKLKEEFYSKISSEVEEMSPGQGRAMIFGMLFKSKMSDPSNINEFYYGFKEGKLKIYKETALFKLFKYMPKSLIEKTVLKDMGNTENET